MATKKDSNNFNYKQAIKHIKSKGFYIIEKRMGEKKGTIAKRMSFVRFGHSKMDGHALFLGVDQKYIPELIFYFDPTNEGSFFFNFAISIVGTKRDAFIPFFGEFETSVREFKSKEKLSETLRLFFEKYQDFIDFILRICFTDLCQSTKSKLTKSLIEARFHKYFVSNGKEIDSENTDSSQFDFEMKTLNDNSIFSIYSKFMLSSTNNSFFNSQTIFLKDLCTGKIHNSKTRSAITNVYKARQLFELCYQELYQSYLESKIYTIKRAEKLLQVAA